GEHGSAIHYGYRLVGEKAATANCNLCVDNASSWANGSLGSYYSELCLSLVAILVTNLYIIGAGANYWCNKAKLKTTIFVSFFIASFYINVITFDGDEVKEKRAGSDGSFDTYFTVPEVDTGPYTVIAEDEDDDDIWAEAVFAIVVNTAIDVNPTTGNVGDEVEVSGEKFTPGDTVTVYFDIADISRALELIEIGTDIIGNNGTFTIDVTIPETTAGQHLIVAEDDEFNSASDIIDIESKIALDIE
ncbi:unnamed protein product, partial [marine sediment metagenome]